MQTLPAMLRFLFSHVLIILLMFSTRPVQFSSTWEAHLSQANYTPRNLSLLFHTNPKKMSVQFCLLPSHIASDFIRFIPRPENVENSAKISSACCISCSSFKNKVKSSAYVQFVWYFPRELWTLRCRDDAFFEAGDALWLFSSYSTFLGVWFVSDCWSTFGLKGGEVRLVNRRRTKVWCFFSRFSFLSFHCHSILPLHFVIV